jgi:hypothetical protein
MSEVRFIRVNGRVVPIKDKGPSKKKLKSNYARHGDAANQASRIDAKYEKKAQGGKAGLAFAATSGIAATYGLIGTNSLKRKVAALGVASVAGIAGHIRQSRRKKKFAVAKEREYVRAFGVTSDGETPMRSSSRKATAQEKRNWAAQMVKKGGSAGGYAKADGSWSNRALSNIEHGRRYGGEAEARKRERDMRKSDRAKQKMIAKYRGTSV